MYVSKIPRTVFGLVPAAVRSVAARLFVLTDGRQGSINHQPTVATFYETGLVTALYEHLLMSPVLAHLEIRHEMPYHGPQGAPKRVDLWLRPVNGGYPHLVEAGDFGVGKIHRDIQKMTGLNPNGANWFIAFFRDPSTASKPWKTLQTSLGRANGLNSQLVEIDRRLTKTFKVYRPNGASDAFGTALIRAR